MNTANKKRHNHDLAYSLLTVLFCSLLFSPPLAARAQSSLAGPYFINKTTALEMPAGWSEKPITYKEWGEGADLAVSLDQHMYPAFKEMIAAYAAQKGIRTR